MSNSPSQWLIYAIASGACAALNGVFAKLTTTTLTSTWATTLSRMLNLSEHDAGRLLEYAIRAIFLLMNLAFNGVMWTLFTKALTLSTSTVRVSVINTSANFVVTALLGAVIFGEELSGLWWLGAGLLVAGSVIIGRREEAGDSGKGDETELKAAMAVEERYENLATSTGTDASGDSSGASKRKRR